MIENSIYTEFLTAPNTNPTRRVDFVFFVDYSTDLDNALSVTAAAVKSCPAVRGSPKPRIELSKAASSSLDISVWAWCLSTEYWNTYFAVERAVFDAYRKAKVNYSILADA